MAYVPRLISWFEPIYVEVEVVDKETGERRIELQRQNSNISYTDIPADVEKGGIPGSFIRRNNITREERVIKR